MSDRFQLLLFLETSKVSQKIENLVLHAKSHPHLWTVDLKGSTPHGLLEKAKILNQKKQMSFGFELLLTQHPEKKLWFSISNAQLYPLVGRNHLILSVNLLDWHADEPDQLVLKKTMPFFHLLLDLTEPRFARCISETEWPDWKRRNQETGLWMHDLISIYSPFFVFNRQDFKHMQQMMPDLDSEITFLTTLENVVVVADRDLQNPLFPNDPEAFNRHREALYRISRFLSFEVWNQN